jgi:C-terminal processing protease CtpA/Prc
MKEKILKPLILILFINFWLQGCDKSDNELNPSVEVQDFVWKGFNAYYLYQEDIDDLSDRRFSSNQQLESYLSGFDSPESIFNSLKKSTDSRSLLIENYEINDLPLPLRTSFTTGMEFGLFKDPNVLDTLIGHVSHILPTSQASSQNLSRGDFFYGVINEETDTIFLREDNYRTLLIDYPQDTLKLLMAYYDGDSLAKNDMRVDLVKQNYQYPPILLNKVFNLGAKNVGYLLYNNDFSDNYIEDLNASMLEFKNQSVNELIIDLRYAIGSYSNAKTMSEIASMITGQFPDEILFKETWNNKSQTWFEQNQPDSLLTKFPSTLQNNSSINGLNLTDVYIILNGNSFSGSSATELLMNSLKPYINVHILGNKTQGDNLGSIYLYDSPDYNSFNVNPNHTYSLRPTVLTFSNKENETYNSGITPTLALCPIEDPLNLGELGEVSDPLLNLTLSYISTGNLGVNYPCNPFELEIIYNSIDSQRIIDKGTFIKQDLPNLGR